MPVISRFHGIVIVMNYNDHDPPHFHARYQEDEVTVGIVAGTVVGRMARRPLRLVLAWADQHQDELLENWKLARERKPLKQIPPME